MIGRRMLLGGAFAAMVGPRAAGAQPAARALRLGVLLYSDPGTDPNFRAFRDGLRDLGWVEGRNLTVEHRHAEGRPERLPELAADLVRARPDVIFALGGDVALGHPKMITQASPRDACSTGRCRECAIRVSRRTFS